MLGLACLFIALAPGEWLSWGGAGGRLFASWVIAGLFASLAGALYLSGSWRVPWPAVGVVWPFILFLVIGIYSLATSPYFDAAFGKGAVQAVGIAAMLLLALSFSSLVAGRLSILLALVKWIVVTEGIIGVIGIVQFIVNNLADGPIVNFQFLNAMLGKPTNFGGLWRASSIVSEPAHMCTFLAAASGFALLRLGLAGRRGIAATRRFTPGWAALGIIGAFAVSLSLVGYVVLAMAGVATLLAHRTTRVGERRRRGIYPYLGGAVLLLLAVAIPVSVGSDLVEKAGTLGLIYQALEPDADPIQSIETGDLSALAIASNAVVALRNLEDRPLVGMGFGAHPVAYQELIPDFADTASLFGLNKDDAASLLLRLLSETGLLGTLAFLVGAFAVLRQNWRIIRLCGNGLDDERIVTLRFIAIGLAGSYVGVLFAYLARLGIYFDSTLWESLAMALSLVSFAPMLSSLRSPLGRSAAIPPARGGAIVPAPGGPHRA